MTNQSTNLNLKVIRKTYETPNIVSLELVDPQSNQLPETQAGAHVDVFLPNGLIRQYSISNNATKDCFYRLSILCDTHSRGGSSSIHADIQEGQLLNISQPRNLFPLAQNAKKHILFAGGIGITPLLSMAYSLSNEGADFNLHYCTRSRSLTAFIPEIEQSPFAPAVQFYFDNDQNGSQFDLDKIMPKPQEDWHIYVCGPTGFMETVMNRARALKWPESSIHYEFFSAQKVVDDQENGAFEIIVKSTGQKIQVPPDKTAVQALSDAGVQISVACEQGICGTCLTKVVEGVPKHLDQYLTPEEHAENNQFTPCCSRSQTPILVIDV